MIRLTPWCLLLGAALGAGCNPNQLAPAGLVNVVDTVTLGALSRAALQLPAAYDITVGSAVRTDQTSAFDFLYDIDSAGQPVLIPIHAIEGLGSSGGNPGLVRETRAFSAITSAPSSGFVSDSAVPIAVGDVFVARSRVACYLGVPQYAKLQVLSFNPADHTVALQILANTNCGYRNLQPGLPED